MTKTTSKRCLAVIFETQFDTLFFSMFFSYLFIWRDKKMVTRMQKRAEWPVETPWTVGTKQYRVIDYKQLFLYACAANIGPNSARNVITHYFRQPNCFSKHNNNFSRWNVYMWLRCQIFWTKNHYISNPSTFIVCLFDICRVPVLFLLHTQTYVCKLIPVAPK